MPLEALAQIPALEPVAFPESTLLPPALRLGQLQKEKVVGKERTGGERWMNIVSSCFQTSGL